jgi:lipase ATG15
VLQGAFPAFRPLPVHAHLSADQRSLLIDHFVVKLRVDARDHAEESTDAMRTESDSYPALCTKQFFGAHVWELAWLALVPYIEEKASVLEFLNRHFSTDWTLKSLSRDPPHHSLEWSAFDHIHSAAKNLTVVSVRGTDFTSFADVLQDINLFFEVGLYHILSCFVPGTSILPSSLVSDFIHAVSMVEMVRDTGTWKSLQRDEPGAFNTNTLDYYRGLFHHVLLNQDQQLVLVGHSLGGAVAQIVGSHLGIPALGFSSPGLVLSRKKFGLSMKELNRFSTTVISSDDLVPMIGGHTGELHHIECTTTTRELCHAMEMILASMWNDCSSIRNRFGGIRSVATSSRL